MGTLHYGTRSFPIEDRMLAHVQAIVGIKLRRNEQFVMSWTAPISVGDGRHAIWIGTGIPLYFEYAGGREPSLNRAWIETMLEDAARGGGLHLTPENIGGRQDPDVIGKAG